MALIPQLKRIHGEHGNDCGVFQDRDVVYVIASFESTSLAKVHSQLPGYYFTRQFSSTPVLA